MTEEIKQEVANEVEGQAVSAEMLTTQLEQLKSTNERLLRESREHKAKSGKVSEYEDKYKSLQREQLEKQGKLQELIDLEREEKSKLAVKLQKQSEQILKGNVRDTISKFAKNVPDVQDILNQEKYVHILEYDESELTITEDSAQKFVEAVRLEKPNLFGAKAVVPMADGKPSINKPVAKTFEQMTPTERNEAMKKAITQISNKE